MIFQSAKINNYHFTLPIIIYTVSACVSVFCVPNIKIQVNNENLQRPPYILEAIKRATVVADAEAAANSPTRIIDDSSINPAASPDKLKSPSAPEGHDEARHSSAADGADSNSYSVVKEETIEEILDLEPESVLRLSPESLVRALSPQDYSKISGDMIASSSNVDESVESGPSEGVVSMKQELRGPSLPVTSSHLKRPAVSSIEEIEKQEAPMAQMAQMDSHQHLGTGAKTFVSPTVAADEPPVNNNQAKSVPSPPDTLAPSQVMNGVINVSMVPATVTREYGHNSRTKITLGGGYVRDRLPPLMNPSSSEYRDEKPEKPVVPLEKTQSIERPEKSNVQSSKVIEVPERIILSASMFDKPARQSSNKLANETSLVKGKLDPRCPSKGVMTLEHPTACDKYFLCEDGYITDQTCPNGLLYGTRDMVKDYCVHRWSIVCGDKTIPNPISTPGCRWQYGIFSVQGSPRCTPDFYECVAGSFEVKKCSINGQVYDDRTKSCQFAEKVGCAEEALADFSCPPDDQANTYWPFPRYFLNDRSIIHCVNDKPAIIRCRDDERVDPEHLHCVAINKSETSNGEAGDSLVSRRAREKKKNANSS